MQKGNGKNKLYKMRFYHINENIEAYFPIDDKARGIFDFSESMWYYWLQAFDKVSNMETELVPVFDDSGNIIAEEFSDYEYIKNNALNNMKGAMIVSIWSLMEYFIKSLMPYLCVLGKNGSKLEEGMAIFEDMYIYENNKRFWSSLAHKLKISKLLKIPATKNCRKTFSFAMFKRAFKKAIRGVKLGDIKEYQHINDIRLLNNIFKHLNGVYNAKQKDCKELSSIIKKKLYIDVDTYITDLKYQNLDISEQVKYCHDFSANIIKLVTNELKNKNLI